MTEEIKVWTQQESIIQRQNCLNSTLTEKQMMIDAQNSNSYPQEQLLDNKRSNESKSPQRYGNDAHSAGRGEQWTIQQERLLIELHNQKGNKWVEIARVLQRSDNSVKNHYHSRLRKALRKINKCLADHMKTECKQLKNNLLSRVIQTAEACYSSKGSSLQEDARAAFKLKNNILAFAELTQQQISTSQINRIRTLVSQISQFNKKYRKQEKCIPAQRNSSNKYKGKEIISLLSQNSGKVLPDITKNTVRETSQSFKVNEEEAQQEKAQKQAVVCNKVDAAMQPVMSSNMKIYNPCEAYYYFEQPYYPIYFSIYPQPSPNIFSGKASSFTYYVPQKQKISEQVTWTSIPRIELDFRKIQNETACNASVEAGQLEIVR